MPNLRTHGAVEGPRKLCQLFVEVAQRRRHLLPMPRVLGGIQVALDADSGQKQALAPRVVRCYPSGCSGTALSLGPLDLGLDIFAFPSTCHGLMVALYGTAVVLEYKIKWVSSRLLQSGNRNSADRRPTSLLRAW